MGSKWGLRRAIRKGRQAAPQGDAAVWERRAPARSRRLGCFNRRGRHRARQNRHGHVRKPAPSQPSASRSNGFSPVCARPSAMGSLSVAEKHCPDHHKDSQSNPNRAAEVTAQLINNDKVDTDDRLVDVRHGQSGVRPMRARRRTLRHLRRSVAGLVLRPQGRPEEGLRMDLPLLLGRRHGRQRVRRHVAVVPTNKVLGTL